MAGCGEGVSSPLVWDITSNKFVGNYGDIYCSLVDSVVRDNQFYRHSVLGLDVPPDAVSVDFSGGRGNLVIENWFDVGATKPGSHDRWQGNHFYGDK